MIDLKFSWRTNKKVYEGASALGTYYVTVNGSSLASGPSRVIIDHSPSGFAWGYGGSGPAQLAVAILYDYTKDPSFALKYHQRFKWDVIAKFPQNSSWVLYDDEIDDWIRENTLKKETWLVRKSLTKQDLTDAATSVGLTPVKFYLNKNNRKMVVGYYDRGWKKIPPKIVEALRTKMLELNPEVEVVTTNKGAHAMWEVPDNVVIVYSPIYRDTPKLPWREIKRRMRAEGYESTVTSHRNEIIIKVWVPNITEVTPRSVKEAKGNEIFAILKEFANNIVFVEDRGVSFLDDVDWLYIFKIEGSGIQNVL